MGLLTNDLLEALIANGKATEQLEGSLDHRPVVKLFTPDGGATWLLTEVLPHDPDIAFGLCDLGIGFPELGYVGSVPAGGEMTL